MNKDTNVLTKLFIVFDDYCPYSEVMWGLVHAIEKYGDENYIKTLLSNLHAVSNAVEWCYILFCRILNHPPSLKILIENIYIANRKLLNTALDMIYKDSERHRIVIKEIKLKLSS